MAESKLARAQKRAAAARAEVRELRDEVDELSEPNPTTLRQFVSVGIIDASAYGGSFLYTHLQRMGLAPTRVPVDGIVGATMQLGAAFFHGGFAAVVRDVGHGVTAGAAGRVASHHAMKTIETDQGPAWLKPTKPGG